MFKSGITKRWLLTTILVIALILFGFALFAFFSIRGYYYDYAQRKLQSIGQSSSVAEFFNGYLNVSNNTFAERAQEYLKSASFIGTAEVWVYNKDGDVILTSTGFAVQEDEKEDYYSALGSPSGRGTGITELPSGEKVMALTVMLPKTGEKSNGAIRYLTSLEDIDNKLIYIAVGISVICLFALLMVIFSGLFFVSSIVDPVKKINSVTRLIAKGQYSERVPVSERYDEIAELSDSINYMAEEIAKTDRLKNDFISTVSHELRTPLTAIKGWTETLITINESEDQTLKDGLKVILNESERLYSMVEELLDFSRMENGRMTLRIQKIDVLAELDEAVFVLRDRAVREGKEIYYSTPDIPAPIDGDPDRIKQVFVNIIDNAIKYTPKDGKISIIALHNADSIKITVSDTGCGIPKDALPHVKEKFYKANMSVKGSGIGLAVCDEIISRHGGTLTIDSTEGIGTQVDVILPLKPLSQPE